jgi:hypothetical protein
VFWVNFRRCLSEQVIEYTAAADIDPFSSVQNERPTLGAERGEDGGEQPNVAASKLGSGNAPWTGKRDCEAMVACRKRRRHPGEQESARSSTCTWLQDAGLTINPACREPDGGRMVQDAEPHALRRAEDR